MKHSLTASIIINTCDRAAYLQRLLCGLDHLNSALFEVVVVNGPSTDETDTVLAAYHDRIKVVSCPTRNLSLSRNLGIAASKGDIVVFIDDDALPADEDWLDRFIAAYDADTGNRMGAVGGPVLHRDTNLYEFKGGVTSDYGVQVFDGDRAGHVDVDGRHWVRGVPGGNTAFRRSALQQIGGFDEFYTYYLDETDVCFRLARAGYRIEYLHDNGIRHYAARAQDPQHQFNRNWDIITRSDTYFALKNGADAAPVRLLKTLAMAPRKHFVHEIGGYLIRRQLSLPRWLRLALLWAIGLVSGVWAGVTQPRLLGDFTHRAPPLVPFQQSRSEAPLRIALLSQAIPGQPGYGGIGRYTFDLAQGLHERGHQVHIICRDERPIQFYNLGFTIHGIPPSDSIPLYDGTDRPILAKNLGYSISVVRKLAELYRHGVEFDVVHASNWDAEAAALIRSQLYPTVLMLVSPLAQVIQTEGWQPNDDLAACVALDRWQIEHADTVCIPSQGVLESYETLMHIEAAGIAKLHHIPLGIVPDWAPPADQAEGPRRRLLFVGRMERRKGAHTLLAVLPRLMQGFPDWECHLVGNDQLPLAGGGTLKEQFLTQHRGAPWLKQVIFHGAVSDTDLRRHYRTCDLFVAPSLFESFGLIYHEAMQYGKSVIGCRTGGVPEVVEDNVEGLLVESDQPEQLHAALSRLMADHKLRHHMGLAGAHRVRHVTNYQSMARGMELVYRELAATVAQERRLQRESVWPRDLPLFGDSPLCFEGAWLTREVDLGGVYRVGQADAVLRLTAPGSSVLALTLLQHRWSGILTLQIGANPSRYVDLYRAAEDYAMRELEVRLPGTADQLVEVVLRVHRERNPSSYASEVWIQRILMQRATTGSNSEQMRPNPTGVGCEGASSLHNA